jgi:hypothetical protein
MMCQPLPKIYKEDTKTCPGKMNFLPSNLARRDTKTYLARDTKTWVIFGIKFRQWSAHHGTDIATAKSDCTRPRQPHKSGSGRRQLRQQGARDGDDSFQAAVVNMCEAEGETAADALAFVAMSRVMFQAFVEWLPPPSEQFNSEGAIFALSIAAKFLVRAEMTLENVTGLSGQAFTGEEFTVQ